VCCTFRIFCYPAAVVLLPQVMLSSSVAHENMVQLLDVFAEGTELIIVVRGASCTEWYYCWRG
jgi:hypothetical protein